MTKTKWFRRIGILSILLGAYCRLNATMILPSSRSYSGDLEFTKCYQLVTGFADIMNIVVGSGVALLIISFTRLMRTDE